MFPVTLCLEGARCLVVGGGEVALRKTAGLVREGAAVTVVAPRAVEGIRELAGAGTLSWQQRSYRSGEAAEYRLVFAATDQREVNRQVHGDASAAGVWVNVADDPELCTFHLPARIERGPLQLAVSSGGSAPFIVRRLREILERRIGAEWGEWAGAAARFRELVRRRGVGADRSEPLYDRFFAETVDAARLRVRVPADAEVEAWSALPNVVDAGPLGQVSLVGAGPGNPGLLTLRGYRRLLAADAVVYDRLAEPALPCDLPAATELISVGKEAGRHPVSQDEINAMLVALARQGKRVVRLKGGDPFVFGRGGEEALALRGAGVPFEIVPGITTGVAGPAFAGVPVTQRGVAGSVTMFTAHQAAGESGEETSPVFLDPARSTLVGFMGVGNLTAVASELARLGVPATTPAMLIERATTSAQRSVRATAGTLSEAAQRAGIKPPALLVVGDSVRLADDLGWFERLPMMGQRLALVGPGGDLAERLELAGAEVIELFVPPTPAALVAIRALPLTGWIARAPAEAGALAAVLGAEAAARGSTAFCVGSAVADAARNAGWPAVQELSRELGGGELVRTIAGG